MVSGAIFGALSALLGAGLGAGGAIGAAAMTARGQGRTEHAQWRRQLQREAYSTLISRCLELRKCLSLIFEELARDPVPRERIEVLLDTLQAARDSVFEAVILVYLEGPPRISEAAWRITELQKESHLKLIAEAYGEGPITDSFLGEAWVERLLGAEKEFRAYAREELEMGGR